jgi:hypothetical protein
MNLSDRFEQFNQDSTYLLYNADHPLKIFIGLDSTGRKTLLVKSAFELKKYKRTYAIDFNLAQKDSMWVFGMHLNNPESSAIFTQLCTDLIDFTFRSVTEKEAIGLFTHRLDLWVSLLKTVTQKKMNESDLRGLIGELLFLSEYMFVKHGIDDSLRSWTGLDKTKKDFSIGETWYEVKAVSHGKRSVEISSIEQLDSNANGFLAILYIEKMSNQFKGLTLKKIIDGILDRLNGEQNDLFMEKLSAINYNLLEDYSDFSYRYVKSEIYEVKPSFPRIIREDLPDEILTCSYELDINMLKAFLTGDEIDDTK